MLISVLALGATWSTIHLIDDLLQGGPETSSAADLLHAGGSVWASTVLAFSLLYFELDGGGAAAGPSACRAALTSPSPNSSTRT